MTAQPMDLDTLMRMPWNPEVDQLQDGTFRLIIKSLPGFELFSHDKAELDGEWKMALRSHLRTSLAHQRAVPLPPMRMPTPERASTGEFVIRWAVA